MPPKKANDPTPGIRAKDAGKAKEKARHIDWKGLQSVSNQITQPSDRTWNLLGLPIIATLLLASAASLIVVGAVLDINDLILLGSLFLFGSVLFFVIMYFTVCRSMCQRNVVTAYDVTADDYEMKEVKSKLTASEQQFYNTAYEDETSLGKDRPVPNEDQLYGNRMRQFLGTPATTSDLKFYENDDDDVTGTPPPPRLALPSDPNDSKNVTFTMDVDKEMAKHTREMSNLELL